MCGQGVMAVKLEDGIEEMERMNGNGYSPTQLWFDPSSTPDRSTSMSSTTTGSLESSQDMTTPTPSVHLPLRSFEVLGTGGRPFEIPKRGPSLPFSKPGFWRAEKGHTEMIWKGARIKSRTSSESSSIKDKSDEEELMDHLVQLSYGSQSDDWALDIDTGSELVQEAKSNDVPEGSVFVESPVAHTNGNDSETSSDEANLVRIPNSTNLVEQGKVDIEVDLATMTAAPVAKVTKEPAHKVDRPEHHIRLARALEYLAKQPDYTGHDGRIWIHYAGRTVTTYPTKPPGTRSSTPVPKSGETDVPVAAIHLTKRQPLIRRRTPKEVRRVKDFVKKREDDEIRRVAIRARHEVEERAVKARAGARASGLRMTPMPGR